MANKKKTSKNAIRAYAKEQYMLPGNDGKHKHSFQKIADEIYRKFTEKVTKQSVMRWSKVIDCNGVSWESQYKASVALGVTDADVTEIGKNGKTMTEVYDDAVVSNVRKISSTNEELNKASVDVLLAWLYACHEKLEELKKENGGVDKIPKDKFDENFDHEDKKLLVVIKKDTDTILEKLRNSAGLDRSNVKFLEDMTDDELFADNNSHEKW